MGVGKGRVEFGGAVGNADINERPRRQPQTRCVGQGLGHGSPKASGPTNLDSKQLENRAQNPSRRPGQRYSARPDAHDFHFSPGPGPRTELPQTPVPMGLRGKKGCPPTPSVSAAILTPERLWLDQPPSPADVGATARPSRPPQRTDASAFRIGD